MKFLLLFHTVLGVVLGLIIYFLYGAHASLSLMAGAGVSLLNLILLVYTWPRILAKKLVALSIGVIVFKFAILGWIIFEVVGRNLFHLGWFSAGLAVVILSVLSASLQTSQDPQTLKAE